MFYAVIYTYIWNIMFNSKPYITKKVIDKLEAVQRKSTQFLGRQEGLIYEERLKELNIYSLAQ